METTSILSIAEDFFQYLGRHLPQQCASDEFYFLPRSEAALLHLTVLDDLNRDKIQEHVTYVRGRLKALGETSTIGLEEEIDAILLKQSMRSFIREFEEEKVWQRDPTLYIKIPLFSVDQVLSQEGSSKERVRSDLLAIFSQVPSFLKQSVVNLQSPSGIALETAVQMARDAFTYHAQDVPLFIEQEFGNDGELLRACATVAGSWQQYERDLQGKATDNTFAVGEYSLKRILQVSLGYPHPPLEILERAEAAYQKTLLGLKKLANTIDAKKSWKEIIYEDLPVALSPEGLLELYRKEVPSLRDFIHEKDFMSIPPSEKVTVLKTPTYLRSLRATASYRAPLTGSREQVGIFYITPGTQDLEMISLHCPYLTAHETYPGHHILDHVRIHHPNSVRRQIESPLFYEGWACYGEQLLDELGYIEDPRVRLVQLKRQLWRDLRAILDVKLHCEKISMKEASARVEVLGYSRTRAQRQIRRFCLTPGYQLCYAMGMYEILALRDQFLPRSNLKTFHDILIQGGQLPFHLAEKRLGEALGD